jgi:hypothetical protein
MDANKEATMRQDNGDRPGLTTDTSRRVIDIAVGVLCGLRGYSEREAFNELVEAVRCTGVGIGSLSAALIALVGGRSESTPYQAEALDFWGETLVSREVYPRSTRLFTARAS